MAKQLGCGVGGTYRESAQRNFREQINRGPPVLFKYTNKHEVELGFERCRILKKRRRVRIGWLAGQSSAHFCQGNLHSLSFWRITPCLWPVNGAFFRLRGDDLDHPFRGVLLSATWSCSLPLEVFSESLRPFSNVSKIYSLAASS